MQPKTSQPTSQFAPSQIGVGPTPRQLQLLKAIRTFQVSRCYSPTIGELALQFGISRSTAFEHITELRQKGLLSGSPGRARSLTLTSKAQNLLSNFIEHSSDSHRQSPTGIPLAGRVAAGSPIEAVEDTKYLSLSSHFGDSDCLFALEVKGDSMIDDGIFNGDFVICRHSSVSDNGQLVIAIVDNEEATLKRFYKEKSCVRLQPANDDFDPIYSDNCRIEAVVIGLVRRL